MHTLAANYSHNTVPVILQDHEIKALLPRLKVQTILSNMFRSLGQQEAVQPPQTVTLLPQGAGDFITYMGAIQGADVFGAKLSPYLIGGEKPIITAWTQLMSQRTGQPLLLCDSGQLTVERTAGTTALALEFLAKQTCSTLAIIGSGPVAIAHLRHVRNLRQWQSIRVYSPSLASNPERRAQFTAIDDRVAFSESAKDCTNEADVIMLCTSSGTPVINPDELTQPALITSISTNVASAHEVPPALLPEADVYCDYKATTAASAGEMTMAEADGMWDKQQICGDLAELVSGTCALPDYSKHVFFRSIGLGLEDIAMAYGLWQLLQNQD